MWMREEIWMMMMKRSLIPFHLQHTILAPGESRVIGKLI
jgi:hypothetical protein